MTKEKIAIAIDKNLLQLIDTKVGSLFASRSQAIEFYLRRGLQEELLHTAVLMLKGEHQEYSLKRVADESLLSAQADFLKSYGINEIHIVTQKSKKFNEFLKEVDEVKRRSKVKISVYETKAKGNAEALAFLQQHINENFLCMSADIFAEFDLRSMISKYLNSAKTATMALMLRDKPVEYGNAVLDGDFIVDFTEKPKRAKSYVVNAGIYVFSPQIFNFLRSGKSLEKDVFPKLASLQQLVGYFVKGAYKHMEE